MQDEPLVQALMAVVAKVQDEGDFRSTDTRTIAEVALRRWRSFDRRHKIRRPTLEHRIEDLAKGLRDRLELEPELVGPEMIIYRNLARSLAEVLAPPEASSH